MGRQILDTELKSWLYDVYRDMTNTAIASELNEKLRRKYQARVQKLKDALPSITHPKTRRDVEKEILFMENFNGIDAAYVRQVAKRLHCPGKTARHISECNREKADITRRKIWLEKAEAVESPIAWLRTFRVREIRYCKLKSVHEIRSWQATISNWNRAEGAGKDIRICSQPDRDILVMRVEAKLSITIR